MIKKITEKDKKDWENFLLNGEKLANKDNFSIKKIRSELTRVIDLHGFTLKEANKMVEQFINKSFLNSVTKIIVITGKGLRSKKKLDPYSSKNLSILKYSVPDFIKSNKVLAKKIIEIEDAKLEDGGSGAFYIYLKNKEKLK